MPAESSSASIRRTTRKVTNDEDVNLRRARGEISCSECRRLKLKCDRQIPCSSCIRRGCSNICPNGSLVTGHSSKHLPSGTAQLYRKIAEMGQRISLLEAALAVFQSDHPLLQEELLTIKLAPDVRREHRSETASDKFEETIDAFGTLTIGNRGEARYFGRSGGSETLFLAGADLGASSGDDVPPPTSEAIARLSMTFPFGDDSLVDTETALDMLYTHLPPQPRAWALCETYLEQASWAFRPILRDELIDDILSPVYRCLKERQSIGTSGLHSVSAHKLAALFMIFALGSIVDLTLPPSNVESVNFYHLSRAALSLRPLFDSPELGTLQTVVLMSSFHTFGAREFTMDSSWCLLSLGVKLAQSMGLHRDSARWHLDAKTVQRRRYLFWELFAYELFHCLSLGRPPSLRLSDIDCEFPEDDESLESQQESQIGYYRWKYEFTREIFAQVTELTMTAKTPSYQTVLDLDRKVREKTLPQHLNTLYSSDDRECTPSVYMRGCLLSQFRSVILLFLHRSFFSQAMLDHPTNPLRSPYAPSFLAAYQCAAVVIKFSQSHYERFPDLCTRIWSLWTHLFSAAIIVGSIVTRAPSSNLAPGAFAELCLAVDVYELGATRTRRARSGLAILYKLRAKAQEVYHQFRSGNPIPTQGILEKDMNNGEDELAIFGGQTRVLVSGILSNRPVNRQNSAPATPLNVTPPPSSSRNDHITSAEVAQAQDVHPSLVEYLSLLPSGQYGGGYTCQSQESGYLEQAQSPAFAAESSLEQHPLNYLPQTFWEQSEASSYADNAGSALPPLSSSVQGYDIHPATPVHGEIALQMSAHNSLPDGPGPLDPQSLNLGMMISGEAGIDDQWIAFMRSSGILNDSHNQTYAI